MLLVKMTVLIVWFMCSHVWFKWSETDVWLSGKHMVQVCKLRLQAKSMCIIRSTSLTSRLWVVDIQSQMVPLKICVFLLDYYGVCLFPSLTKSNDKCGRSRLFCSTASKLSYWCLIWCLTYFMQNNKSIFNSESFSNTTNWIGQNVSNQTHMCRRNWCPYLFESKQTCTHLLVCLFCRLNSLTPFFSLVTFGWEECMYLLGMSDCVLFQGREKYNHQYVFSLQNEQTLMYSCIWII